MAGEKGWREGMGGGGPSLRWVCAKHKRGKSLSAARADMLRMPLPYYDPTYFLHMIVGESFLPMQM